MTMRRNAVRHIFLLGIFTISILTTGMGQHCIPDSTYRDSTAGIYPRPITDENPDGGIDTFACIGQEWEFTFTVIIPDTFSFNGLTFQLDSASIEEEGAVEGLPEGIDYACDPPDCVYPANSMGCVVLRGTPTAANTPGDYEPVITMTIYTSSFPVTTTFPGPVFPGKYILELRDAQCLPTATEHFAWPDAWASYPNPVSDTWTVEFDAGTASSHTVEVHSLTGVQVMQRRWDGTGQQNVAFDVSGISPGLYTYTVRSGDRIAAGKLVVAR
jgi:hypothetical protein